MQNCYNAAKPPQEVDGRLTKKHIETLKFVQEIAQENKELKARVEELEKEGSKCAELHALARNSQKRIKEIQEQYLARADEINQMLTEKHKAELMKKVEEQVDAEKTWAEEKRQLLAEIDQLKKEILRLIDELKIARDQTDQTEVLQAELNKQGDTIEELKSENARLEQAHQNQLAEIQRLQYVDDTCRNMSQQISELKQHNQELEFRIDRLQQELGQSGYNKQEDLLNTLKNKLSKLHLEKQNFEARDKEQLSTIQELGEELEKLRRAYGDSERMRGDLKVQYDALLLELNQLKRQTSGDRQTFHDFVQLKREMAAVVDENEQLKIKLKWGKTKHHSLKHTPENVTVTVAKLDSGKNNRRESFPSYTKR